MGCESLQIRWRIPRRAVLIIWIFMRYLRCLKYFTNVIPSFCYNGVEIIHTLTTAIKAWIWNPNFHSNKSNLGGSRVKLIKFQFFLSSRIWDLLLNSNSFKLGYWSINTLSHTKRECSHYCRRTVSCERSWRNEHLEIAGRSTTMPERFSFSPRMGYFSECFQLAAAFTGLNYAQRLRGFFLSALAAVRA